MNSAYPIPPEALKESARRERERIYHQNYRATHPELKAYYAARYQANKGKPLDAARADAKRAYMKAYRQKNRARLAAQDKVRKLANAEKAREREKLRKRPNKRAQDARWRAENPGTYRASIARSKAAKPELYRASAVKQSQARRARKKGAHSEPVSFKRIIARDRDRCHLCGGRISRPDRTFDHLIPIARHGAHAEWNFMLAHDRCNKSRGTRQILAVETKEAALAYIAERAL